jgi:hypothetical protein
MSIGRRCDSGCTGSQSWPDKAIYGKCPMCGEATERYSNLQPMPDDEAQSILTKHEFESYYEKRCAERNIPAGDGPLPDDYEITVDGGLDALERFGTMISTDWEPHFARPQRASS